MQTSQGKKRVYVLPMEEVQRALGQNGMGIVTDRRKAGQALNQAKGRVLETLVAQDLLDDYGFICKSFENYGSDLQNVAGDIKSTSGKTISVSAKQFAEIVRCRRTDTPYFIAIYLLNDDIAEHVGVVNAAQLHDEGLFSESMFDVCAFGAGKGQFVNFSDAIKYLLDAARVKQTVLQLTSHSDASE